ncbi:MAG: flagellar basal body L-ring protein FlgH [Comamonas sp.]
MFKATVFNFSTASAIAMALLASGCALSPNAPPAVDMPVATTPPVLQPREQVAQAATGSLFNASRYRPMFEDQRARMVGDSVTVNIVERVSASQSTDSKVGRSNELKTGVSALPLLSGGVEREIAKALEVGATSKNDFKGSGGTSSNNTFTGSIATTVIDVLPNGHLVIAGEKQIGVNHNVDVLRFTGTVDPRSLRPGSSVASTQVANLRVESRSRGQAGEAQSIGWLSRFFLNVMPF